MKPSRLVLPLLAVLLLMPGPAQGGADDFDYGRRLAENRYFRYARMVFERMLADPSAKPETKDLAKFGLATLSYEEARSATRKEDAAFAEVLKLANAAADEIKEFAKKNPGHPKANEARITAGSVKIWIVTWCRELVQEPEQLPARKTTASDVQAAAKTAVNQAEEEFAALKKEPGNLGELANFHWTMCQYWRALVFDPCSADQKSALAKAAIDLDTYASDNDGKLLGVYAQDFLGQTFAAQAKCATSDEERLQLTNKALQWFETCILTEYLDAETLDVIAAGYQHFGQACLEAKRIGQTNFLRDGVQMLSKMSDNPPLKVALSRHPTGIRAWIVLGDLHLELGDAGEAVKIYKLASDYASAVGQQGLVQTAGTKIRDAIRQGSGAVTDVDTLKKVAMSLVADDKPEEAIPAFRRVIEVAPSTPQGFEEYVWPAWEQISAAYEKLGDPLGAALALEGVYEAWKDGRIPGKRDDPAEKNMIRAGNGRLRQESLLNGVARTLGSRPLQDLAKRVMESFAGDFPHHPSAGAKDTKRAIDLFREALDARRNGDATWRTKMETARTAWEAIARNAQSTMQDTGWSRLVLIDKLLGDGNAKAAERGLATIAEARAFWASDAGKKRLVDFPDLATQRKEAEGDVSAYEGELLRSLDRWTDVRAKMQEVLANPAWSKHHDDASALVVEATIELGEMEAADKLLAVHLQRFPKHPANNALVGKVAKKFDDQYRELTKSWNAKNLELNGPPEDRSQGVTDQAKRAAEEYNRTMHGRVDLQGQVDTLERKIAAWKVDPGQVKDLNELIVKELESTKLPALRKRIEESSKKMPDLEKKAADLQARADAIRAEMDAIVEQQYQPLVEAVSRYQKGWDSQYAEKPLTADPKSTLDIATRWYFAAKNKNGKPSDWDQARTMFEHYLALDAVKALPESDKDKRSAIAKLGRVYSQQANAETDPAKRTEMVRKAVVMLESNIAQRPENNELVVGLLEGRYAVVFWENTQERDRPSYRFVVPRTGSAVALAEAVQKLGTPESKVPLPVQADVNKTATYKKGLQDWKAFLAKNPDELKAAWNDTRGGGMDVASYAELANTDRQFRLAIASAYTESGEDADFTKAEAVLGTLLKGRLAPQDYDEDWWEATTITLRLWIGATERWAAQGGAVAAKVSQYRQRAKSLIQGRLAFDQVPTEGGLRAEWRKLIDRLNEGLKAENAPILVLDLDKPALGGGEKEEPK